MERRKYLGRAHKDYYKKFSSKVIRVDDGDIQGYAAYMAFEEVNRPFMVGTGDDEICLVNNGYSEIDYLPDCQNWGLSAMYDNHGDIVEWYVDITRKNAVDEAGEPYCDDLYLDAALMPDGRILVFDEDELQNALTCGGITQADYDMAYQVLAKLRQEILNVDDMTALCARLKAFFTL